MCSSDLGTLGFGVLEHDATVTTAYPVRIGADGSFTFHGTRHTSRPGAHAAGEAGSSSVNSTSTVEPLSPAM